jgi:hypothetical protein
MTDPNVVYDVRGLLRELDALEPGLKNAMVREAKGAAKPIVTIVKQAIPSKPALSGMGKTTKSGGSNTGRLAWGAVKPAKSVTVKFRSSRSTRSAITPLVSVWVNSPIVAISDIAGKGALRKAKAVTSEYAYKDGTRKHRVTTQGRTLIRVLKERNLNNFIYPNVEDSLDDVSGEIKLVVERYARKVNRKLN